jgi:hypothetical protein
MCYELLRLSLYGDIRCREPAHKRERDGMAELHSSVVERARVKCEALHKVEPEWLVAKGRLGCVIRQ